MTTRCFTKLFMLKIFTRLSADHEDSPDLKLRNAAGEGQAENLIKLPFLNEPAILHCLQERYEAGLIYTYTGPILIAVNPFKRVNLYTQAILDEYYNKGLMKSMGADVGTELSPHVYAIADNAYRQMMGVIVRGNSNDKSGDQRCNQSILISGESGAGKTESTKVVLSYLTTVGRAIDSSESFQGSIMEKVLQSNPILEAFGNAKTKRNDNSSRFGKFIQLNFNRRGNLIGGSIKTYLLEKVRLPLQQTGERNFHIFYQLVAGSSEEERRRLGLTRLEDFNYTSKSGIFLLNNVNDAEEFETLKSALSTLKFAEADQNHLLDIVSGILHLGQLQFQSFVDGEGEGSVVESTPENVSSLELCTSLLGLTASQLTDALTIRQISAAGETYFKKMTKLQAADGRDALAKAIYGKLFDWIVATINTRIEVDPVNVKATIGVLDIFGFESFAINSFEQLCINYANETLQQQFNQFIFKLEQIEYEREKIEWSFIQFPDNKDCLELIEHKIHGIFSMLDDECRLPKASDEKFASRMYKEYAANGRFGATAAQKRSGKFSVNHYAGSVEYTVVTFVEKNKDELPKEANNLLQSSSNQLLKTFFRPAISAAAIDVDTAVIPAAKRKSLGAPKPAAAAVVQSVGTQFKDQLNNLMSTIYATAPHYIRCLKPNDQNVADNFTRLRITEQLRYGGVLEAVRVARSGFPVRLAHEEFYRRYKMIVHARIGAKPSNYKVFCGEFVNVLHEMATTSSRMNKLEQYSFDFKGKVSLDGFQVGLTKLFLRKDSHDFLETCRYRCMHFASVQLQSFSRGCNLRVTYRNKRAAARLIQRYFRGSVARAAVDAIRKNRATTKIQAVGRMYITMRRFYAFRYALLKLQSHWRRLVLQRLYLTKRKEIASVRVAKYWRMHCQRRKYVRFLFALKKLQCKVRVHEAKQLLRKLRTEAKDLGKLQENNETLKKEIEELKARAAEERLRLQQEFERKAKESLLATKAVEMDAMKAKMLELEELLRQETRAKEEAEKRASLLELGGMCRKCREKRSDENAHSQSPSSFPNGDSLDHDSTSPLPSAARRNSRRNSAGDSLRLALAMGPKDSTDTSTPVKQGQNSNSTATPIKSAHIEEYKQANELLQSEIGRLRNTNIEHLATIETLKRELLRAKEEEKEKSRVEQTPKRSKGQELLRTPRRGSAKFKDVVERVASPTNVERVESPSNAPGWGNAWDAEEDDSTESGSVQDVQALTNANTSLNSSSKPAAVTAEIAAISSLEKNLEKWKGELMKVRSLFSLYHILCHLLNYHVTT